MQSENGVIAMVLAAGRATRFGQDKRVVALTEARSLLQATVDSMSKQFESVYVVIRADDDAEVLSLFGKPVMVVRSVNADRGMGFSIADGFAALSGAQAAAAAVLLGDMPCIEADTFQTLIDHARENLIVRPEYHGRAGHPVLFGRCFWDELSQLEGEEGARSVIHRHPEACMHIEVDDSGVLMDADRPEDLEALREHYNSMRNRGSDAFAVKKGC